MIKTKYPTRKSVNFDKPQQWKDDIAKSVDMYNDWFMTFAPKAFRETRIQTTEDVKATLRDTGNLTDVQPATLRNHPGILSTLRMSTCPPIAVDRLIPYYSRREVKKDEDMW